MVCLSVAPGRCPGFRIVRGCGQAPALHAVQCSAVQCSRICETAKKIVPVQPTGMDSNYNTSSVLLDTGTGNSAEDTGTR